MKTLKVLSALLTYPTPELLAAADELKAVLRREGVLKRQALDGVLALIDDLGQGDLYDAQECYILLFDRTRSLSLHLFEHVHGESRDRGQAMVDLIKVYEDGGFTPTLSELPDFLPLFLEYASIQSPETALELIGSQATSLPRWPSVWPNAVRPIGPCSRPWSHWPRRSSTRRRSTRCVPSLTPSRTILRRSTPPGRRRKFASGRALRRTTAARTRLPPSSGKRAGPLRS